MVKRANGIGPWLGICILSWLGVSGAWAKDLAAYNPGDTVEEDVMAPLPFDAVDPGATAARRAEEALKTPAIFRNYPATTNEVEQGFIAQFNGARANFTTAINSAFMLNTLDEAAIASPAFDTMLAAFNKKNKTLPLSTNLAKLWARGYPGDDVLKTCLAHLREAQRRPIRADDLPANIALGETLRVVSLKDGQEPLTLADAERRGKIGTQTAVITLTRARSILRKLFPEDEQNFARAMTALLKPTCVLDEALTQQARAGQTAQIVVTVHYAAGEIVARRGQAVDAKIKAAFDQLRDKAIVAQLNQQAATEREQAQKAQAAAAHEREQAQQAQQQAQRDREQAQKAQHQAQQDREQAQQTHHRNVILTAVAGGAAFIAVLAVGGIIFQRRRNPKHQARMEVLPPPASAVLIENGRVENPPAPAQPNLDPQLAQALKEAVVQGLAEQRSELLQAQQRAAAEIAELVGRLDKLQVPMHDRLRTYETRIEQLENGLATRNQENQELLRLKIDMTRRQMETERARTQVEDSWGSAIN